MTPEFTAAQLAEARQLLEDVRADLQNHALLPTWQRKICAFLSYAPAQPKLDYDTAIDLIRAGCGACLADAKPYWHPTGTPCPTPSPETGTAAVPTPRHELLSLILANHYVTVVECNHETRMDTVRCACSRWTGTPQPSVGFAIKEWINHVTGILDAGDYLAAAGAGPAPEPVKPPAKHYHEFWGVNAGGAVGSGVCACGAVACRTCLGSGTMATEMGCFGPKAFGRCTECDGGVARTPAAGTAPTEACVQQCFSWGCRSSCARRDKHTADEFHGCLDHGGIREGSSK